ncbi:gamma-glutamyltransferase [Mycoplasmatota bacterium zrk1]
MEHDYLYQRYKSNRYSVTAKNGMVATSQPLAAQAGLDILKKGGNAIDAAVATAAALTVVEPTSNGIGSDAFALVWINNKLHGLNASGVTPKSISIEEVKKNNETMPKFGWTPVTVPGTPKAWARLVERFGNLSLYECLEPAINLASDGYSITPVLGKYWKGAFKKYSKVFKGEEFNEWFNTFTIKGKAPEIGDIITLKNHGSTLESIGKTNSDSFYKGNLADKIEKDSKKHGGFIRKSDLESFDVEWVDPISVEYRGFNVWEIPPNGQGIVALMGLNILKNFGITHNDYLTYHRQIESMKLAFADGLHYITDPKLMKFNAKELLSEGYAKKRSELITESAITPEVGKPNGSGTVYLATADKWGNMVSYIQSNYMGFGSGIVVEGTGIALQNRGADFSLDFNHYNKLMPNKRTYHTIIPGFITKGDKPIGPFGVMGGYMQPQGHLQVVCNMIDFNLNPQMALDAPRWQWMKDKSILVEPNFDLSIVDKLRRMGHDVKIAPDTGSFGRGQIIIKLENGAYVGGTESRTDGHIAIY